MNPRWGPLRPVADILDLVGEAAAAAVVIAATAAAASLLAVVDPPAELERTGTDTAGQAEHPPTSRPPR